jgi:hypothetical protein
MPRRRRPARVRRPVDPVSPDARQGRLRGRPRPGRRLAPRGISGSKTVDACCWPGVRSPGSGLPCPSAVRGTWGEQPPWRRPTAAAAGSPPPLGAGGVRVGADDAASDEGDAPVDRPGRSFRLLDGRAEPVPEPGLPPAPAAAGHLRPGAGPVRPVAPRRPGPPSPHDAVDDPPMARVRPARLRPLRRPERLEPLPLLVGELSPGAHADRRANSGPPIWSLCVQALMTGARVGSVSWQPVAGR